MASYAGGIVASVLFTVFGGPGILLVLWPVVDDALSDCERSAPRARPRQDVR